MQGEMALIAALGSTLHRAVILADGQGYIRFWNAGAEALFGHASLDALGQRVDLVVPHPYREMHWAGFNRTIGSRWPGADSWGAIEGLHSTGALVALEVLLTPILDDDGRVDSVLAMFRRPPG
jgi:PAS domain S-box-containing protein